MLKSKAFTIGLVTMVLMGMTPFRAQTGAAVPVNTGSTAAVESAKNKFVGRWTSQITTASGQVYDDGVIDITEMAESSEDEVMVSHSVRGGPVIAHTMAYPDRIEIQIPLSDGRVAHYNGVLVSATRIEGRFFVTRNAQSHHSRSVSLPFAEGTFTAQAGAG